MIMNCKKASSFSALLKMERRCFSSRNGILLQPGETVPTPEKVKLECWRRVEKAFLQ
jgi:hypothetical protein